MTDQIDIMLEIRIWEQNAETLDRWLLTWDVFDFDTERIDALFVKWPCLDEPERRRNVVDLSMYAKRILMQVERDHPVAEMRYRVRALLTELYLAAKVCLYITKEAAPVLWRQRKFIAEKYADRGKISSTLITILDRIEEAFGIPARKRPSLFEHDRLK